MGIFGPDITSRAAAKRAGHRRGRAWGTRFTADEEAAGRGSNARAVPLRWRRVFERAYNRASA